MAATIKPPLASGLASFDAVMLNSSGGKDSQTMIRQVVLLADQEGYDRNKLCVTHADLGRMEWPGVKELAREQAEHYGLRFECVKYRDKDGEELDLLELIARRGRWPDGMNRYCTSEMKRGPCARMITQLHKEVAERNGMTTRSYLANILSVMGMRGNESPARKKRPVLEPDKRTSSKMRNVFKWLPLHHWTIEEVWRDVKASGVRYHQAYDWGMPRLSCCFCIYAPPAALMLAAEKNPELFQQYLQLERDMNHQFQIPGKTTTSLAKVELRMMEGDSVQPAQLNTLWDM